MYIEFYEYLITDDSFKKKTNRSNKLENDTNSPEDVYSLYLKYYKTEREELERIYQNISDELQRLLIREIVFFKIYEELKMQYPTIFNISKKGLSRNKVINELNNISNDKLYIYLKTDGISFIVSHNYPLIASKAIIWVLSAVDDVNNCLKIFDNLFVIYQTSKIIISHLYEMRINFMFKNGMKSSLSKELKKRKPLVERNLYLFVYNETIYPSRIGLFYTIISFILFMYLPKLLIPILFFSILFHGVLFLYTRRIGNYLLCERLFFKGYFLSICIILGYILYLILHIGT
jgi:hypothetical protein